MFVEVRETFALYVPRSIMEALDIYVWNIKAEYLERKKAYSL